MGGKHEKKQLGSVSAASRRQPAAAFKGASKVPGQGTRSDRLSEVLSLFQGMKSFPSRGDGRYTFSEKVKKYISEVPTESISRLRLFTSFLPANPYAVSQALVEICNDKKQERAVRIEALIFLSQKDNIRLIIKASSKGKEILLLDPMKVILENHQVLIAMSKVNDISFNPNLVEEIANHLFQKRQELLLTSEGLELLPYAIALSTDENDGSSLPAKYLFLTKEVSVLPSEAKREILFGVVSLSNSLRVQEYAAELLDEIGSPTSIPPTEHAGSLA